MIVQRDQFIQYIAASLRGERKTENCHSRHTRERSHLISNELIVGTGRSMVLTWVNVSSPPSVSRKRDSEVSVGENV